MDYTTWRITYQSAEQAARAAYKSAQQHLSRVQKLEEEASQAKAEIDALAAHVERLRLPSDAMLEAARTWQHTEYVYDEFAWKKFYRGIWHAMLAEAGAPETSLARLEAAERERDALAAHVEKVCQAWWKARGTDDNAGAILAMDETVLAVPETSLASRDLVKLAEGLEDESDNVGYWAGVRLRERAAELRRQAEEGS